MAARPLARALRLARAAAAARPLAAAARPALVPRVAPLAPVTAVRGVKTIDFAGTKETVYEREDWPREKLQVCFPG